MSSINRLIIVTKRILTLNKRFISTTNNFRISKFTSVLASHKSSSTVGNKNSDVDEKLIARLTAEDPLTDKSELDKPEWERSSRFRVYYGFSIEDPVFDKMMMSFMSFTLVTVLVALVGFTVYYFPDYRLADWTYREAHLEISRRRKRGEPLVSPDFIPVDQITLPTDEELGEFEIKI